MADEKLVVRKVARMIGLAVLIQEDDWVRVLFLKFPSYLQKVARS